MIPISERTLEILKNMGTMSTRVVFKKGNRILQKPDDLSNPIVEAIVDEEFPCDFQIYNIDKFVNLCKMMDEPKLEIDPTQVIVTDANNREAVLRCADLNVLRGVPDYARAIRLPNVDAQFTVGEDDWKALSRSASIVDAPQLAFIGDGTRIRLSTFDVYNGKSKDTFSMEVGSTDRKFTMIIDSQFLKMLPDSYEVSLSFKGLAQFKAEDITYFVAANEKSKYA
ncbi:putative sliding clamp DNA polymerase accessory protein [Rhizobium phage RHph_I1_18]|nr:putative sliding clamp DNA polymerase accessory protein [Rhizobium phage RHph_I1_18]